MSLYLTPFIRILVCQFSCYLCFSWNNNLASFLERNGIMSFTTQQPGSGSRPIALVSQLRQQALQMQHIDDLFVWVTHTMVEQWQIPLIQIWATQAYTTGNVRLELRTTASQDAALPTGVHANQHIADIVKPLLREKRGTMSQPTTSVFSSAQVEALARYGLHYWTGYFLGNTLLLPPRKEAVGAKTATPLCIMLSLFSHQQPTERLGRALDFTFHNVLLVAANRGFLTPPSGQTHTSTSNESAPPALDTLIPQRAEDIEAMKTGNPFANAIVLPDKRTRQLYSLINGQRDVATLASLASLEQEEIKETLHFLLQQKHIQLHDVDGKSINLVLKHA